MASVGETKFGYIRLIFCRIWVSLSVCCYYNSGCPSDVMVGDFFISSVTFFLVSHKDLVLVQPPSSLTLKAPLISSPHIHFCTICTLMIHRPMATVCMYALPRCAERVKQSAFLQRTWSSVDRCTKFFQSKLISEYWI